MEKNNKFIIGIDASRNRSGGAKAHIIGLINSLKVDAKNSIEIHIWSYKSLLELIPNIDYVIKHNSDEL